MKLFCLHCNKPTVYESSAPKFCSHCGKSYIDTSTATIQQNKPIATMTRPKHEPLEDFDEDEVAQLEKIPNIDKLDFAINVTNWRPNRQNGKDVFTESISRNEEIQPRKGKKVSKAAEKRAKEEFKKGFSQDFNKGTRRNRDANDE